MDYRIEKDTLGEVQVPADKLWGAQTERSRNNFKIGQPASMPLDIIRGFAYLKKGAAFANHELGVLPVEKRDLIAAVCDEILEGKLDDQFPLVIWQTGSGTQSNMNVNEVIAHLASEHLGRKIHPNDHVNRSQSSLVRRSAKAKRRSSPTMTSISLSHPTIPSPPACTSLATRKS
mgnify:CR=1 FL=1